MTTSSILALAGMAVITAAKARVNAGLDKQVLRMVW